MTQKGSNKAIGTHCLESRRGGTNQGRKWSERAKVLTPWRAQKEERVRTRRECKRARDTHSLENRERNKSGHGKVTGSEGHSRTGKRREGETSHSTKRNPMREMHPQTMERKGKDKSGHGKKLNERGIPTDYPVQKWDKWERGKEACEQRALTHWRAHRDGKV